MPKLPPPTAATRPAPPSLAERIALLARHLPESLWLVDVAERRVIYANDAYEQVWNASREVLFADRFDWLNHVHPDDADRLRATVRRHPHGGIDTRFRLAGDDAQPRWLHMKSFAIGDGPRPHTIGGIAFDVTDVLAAEARAQHLTHFDALTGLANRNRFREQACEALRSAERHRRRVAVLCLGLDNFQSINENLSYKVGDSVLEILAHRLRGHLRAGDLVGRLGGAQFGFVLNEQETPWDVSRAARRLIELAARPMVVDGHNVFLGASAGIAEYPEDGGDWDQLLYRAESALHEAKQAGGNCFRFFEPSANELVRARQQAELALRRAVQEEQFVVHYQPKVSCHTGAVIGVEALVRWAHPQRGLLAPSEFIGLMEETGLVVALGNWVLRHTCRQAAQWRAEGLEPVTVAVNLSARQLHDGGLVEQVRDALADSGLPPGALELELTESMLMEDVEATIDTLRAIRALGVRLSVDDFGTGYSSLAYLKRFPLDAVKVDRSFVQDITADPDDVSITRAVITMAHALRLKVVAEGVETEGQLALLVANRCDEIQGYYFSRPLPADELAALLRTGRTLPQHLLHPGDRERTVLLVDDEPHILAAMQRILHREGYRIHSAAGAAEGLEVLAAHPVDVIVTDQRMPGMSGVEFLRRAKVLHPETMRIVLSGYTDLQTVTEAINEGAVYKFITKPWEDEQLRGSIAEAFRQKELAEENRRLSMSVQLANRELEDANAQLRQLLAERDERIVRDQAALGVMRELLEMLPWPLLGVDEDGLVVMMNQRAEALFGPQGALLGMHASHLLPGAALPALIDGRADEAALELGGVRYRARAQSLGLNSAGRGRVLTLHAGDTDGH